MRGAGGSRCPRGELRAGCGAGIDAPPSACGGDPRGGVRGVQPGGGRVAGVARGSRTRSSCARRAACWCSECRRSWLRGRWRACSARGAGSPTRCSRSWRQSRRSWHSWWRFQTGSGCCGSVGVVYLVACVACVAVHSPMGANVERYGVLLAGPLLLCALQSSGGRSRRRGALGGGAPGGGFPRGGVLGGGSPRWLWSLWWASACGRCGGRCAKRRRWRATSRRAPPTTYRSSASWPHTGAAL